MSKRKFQLQSGSFNHTDGRTYKKGDIVTTTLDLPKMFVNKFVEVGALPQPSEAIVDSDLEGLLKERREKKVREQLGEGEPKSNEKPKAAKNGKADAPLASRGIDVTSKFELAEEEGFSVFKREKLYHVYEGDSTRPINEKGLESDDVTPFIKKFLKD